MQTLTIQKRSFTKFVLAVCCFGILAGADLFGQDGPYVKKNDIKSNRLRGQNILEQVRWVLKTQYYDPKLKGVDLEARVKQTEEKIKSLDHNWQIYREIAQLIGELGDSHTMFWPPDRMYAVEYGFASMMIGNSCFVTEVKRGSDAEKKGLQVGDEILLYGVVKPTRTDLNTINYIIYGLDWQEKLSLKVKTLDGTEKDIVIDTKFISPKERRKERQERRSDEAAKPFFCKELDTETIACKLRTFDTEPKAIDELLAKVGTRQKLILDLRGNGGGSLKVLERLISKTFTKDVVVGKQTRRGETKEISVKGRQDAFAGALGVLVDSDSASASEVFAKVVMMEKRGTVYGDTTSGSVMLSVYYGLEIPQSLASVSNQMSMPYWIALMQVSVAEFVANDGDKIEGVGIVPHLTLIPTRIELSKRHDPVLSYVAARLGVKVSAEDAGKLNFLVPKTEERLDGGSAEPETTM